MTDSTRNEARDRRLEVRSRPWLAVGTLCQRELVRFVRQRNRMFGALGQPVIFWLLFSEGLKGRDLDYRHFFPGTLVMILLFTAIFTTISIIEDRREGFMQSVLVAPIDRWSMVLGKVLGGTLIALAQGMLFLGLGWLTLGFDLSAWTLALIVALSFTISFALTSLGFLIAWRMDSTQGFHAVMSVFLMPMWLLSGAFFPASTEGLLGWVVRLNPLTYGVAGLRRLLTYSAEPAATAELLPSLSVVWIVTILFALTMFSLAWKIAGTRSTGDLL